MPEQVSLGVALEPKAVELAADSSVKGSDQAGVAAVSHSIETDDRLKRADAHFNSGRQMYFQGNLAGARREFDAAVDVLLNAPDNLPDHRRIERRIDEICDVIYRFDVEKLGAGQEEEAQTFDQAPIDEISHMTFPVDEKLAPKLKLELNQTSSGIPLELPRAVSNKQAVGMWQFISGTGSDYSLSRSSTVDERLDPEKATHAAAKYLKDLYARYGDWYLAMAAYNCGAGAVDRAIERTGYADYWELLKRHALPKETASYVPIIVAMTIMAKNPKDYGIEDVTFDEPVDYESVRLTASTNLNLIADATMQPLSAIRDLNPSLLRMVAPEGFEIHIPKGSADAARVALESVPAQNRLAWRLHHVESGDTLEAIAKTYHITPARIAAVNDTGESLATGNMILIPAVYQEEVQHHARMRSNHSKTSVAASFKSKRSASGAARIAASRRVSSSTLHHKVTMRGAD